MSKKQIRERIRTLLSSQTEDERLSKSLAIKNKLFNLAEFQNANVVLFYASCKGEVETFEMITQALQSKKIIGLPKVNQAGRTIEPFIIDSLDNLETGAYNIKEPKADESKRLDVNAIDCVVVPGVAFDQHNNRLGRGAGYYDRFLASLPEKVPTVGLGFDFQLFDSLPEQQEHDIPVTCVITN